MILFCHISLHPQKTKTMKGIVTSWQLVTSQLITQYLNIQRYLYSLAQYKCFEHLSFQFEVKLFCDKKMAVKIQILHIFSYWMVTSTRPIVARMIWWSFSKSCLTIQTFVQFLFSNLHNRKIWNARFKFTLLFIH